jgi:hypothetical protein
MSALDDRTPIKARRRRELWRAIFTMVATSELFFGSFVFGAWLGPAPMRPLEILGGGLFSAALGLVMAWPLVKKRIESDARWVTQLREGGKGRSVSFFEDHVVVDKEIIPARRILRAALEDEKLLLRYDVFGEREAIERTFEAPLATLERMEGLLQDLQTARESPDAPSSQQPGA